MTYGCEPRLHVLHKPESSTLAGIFVASNLWHAAWQLSCDWNAGILISWQPGIAAVFGYSLSTGCYQIIVDKLDSVGGRFFTMVWSSAIGVKKGELIVTFDHDLNARLVYLCYVVFSNQEFCIWSGLST